MCLCVCWYKYKYKHTHTAHGCVCRYTHTHLSVCPFPQERLPRGRLISAEGKVLCQKEARGRPLVQSQA